MSTSAISTLAELRVRLEQSVLAHGHRIDRALEAAEQARRDLMSAQDRSGVSAAALTRATIEQLHALLVTAGALPESCRLTWSVEPYRDELSGFNHVRVGAQLNWRRSIRSFGVAEARWDPIAEGWLIGEDHTLPVPQASERLVELFVSAAEAAMAAILGGGEENEQPADRFGIEAIFRAGLE